MGKKSVRLFFFFLILILHLEPSLADNHHELNLNETAEVAPLWSKSPVYDERYNESYSQSINLSSDNTSGSENSTLNISTQVNSREITTFPIEDNHIVAVGLCAALLAIFGIIIVKN